ncbi:MAG: RcpC/CpaB family pilus assembly protein [Actinomycetota bacterium]
MNIARTRAAGVAAAVVLAAAGTVLLATYVNDAEKRALQGTEVADVLVLTAPAPKGTRSEELLPLVRAESVPVKVRATGAVADLGSLAGKVAAVDLVPGEQVVAARFADPAQVAASAVPPGLQEVTVALEAVRALGGTLRAGDTVGVIASFDGTAETTHLILHKVLVTDVRSSDGNAPKAAATSSEPALTGTVLVTLAVDAPSAERVVFAAEHGRLWLSRQPLAASESGTKVQTRGAVNG